MKMTCLGEGLANVKLEWLCFSSYVLLTRISLWYVEKLQLEFIPIPIPIALLPFPYFYFHSHSHDIVIVTPIPMGIPWDPWDPNCSHSHAHIYCRCPPHQSVEAPSGERLRGIEACTVFHPYLSASVPTWYPSMWNYNCQSALKG